MPGTDEEFTAKMNAFMTPNGEYSAYGIEIEIYVGSQDEPSYKLSINNEFIGGIPMD